MYVRYTILRDFIDSWAATWPCSVLRGHDVVVEYDPRGNLVDLTTDPPLADVPSNELGALVGAWQDYQEELDRVLKEIEVFEASDYPDAGLDVGWYFWYCLPGCLPDGEPVGPYNSREEAEEAAREDSERYLW